MRNLIVAVALLMLVGTAAMAGENAEDGWAGSPGSGGIYGAYWTNWTQTGGSNSWTGWWDNDDSRWVPATGVGGDDGLVVEAYVELYASQAQQTKAVFHWGAPPFAAQTAVLKGHIVQNHPCWVGIRKDGWLQGDETQASQLAFEKDGFGGTAAKPDDQGFGEALGDDVSPISLEWKIKVGNTLAEMDWSGGVGAANWGWYSPGRIPVGAVDYEFQVTATPNPYQADGKYTLDPAVILVPDL